MKLQALSITDGLTFNRLKRILEGNHITLTSSVPREAALNIAQTHLQSVFISYQYTDPDTIRNIIIECRDRDIPVIILADMSSVEDRLAISNLGADFNLEKNASAEEIIASTNSLLKRYIQNRWVLYEPGWLKHMRFNTPSWVRLMNNATYPLAMVDTNWNIKQVNGRLTKLLHQDNAGGNGRKCHKLFHKTERPCDNCPLYCKEISANLAGFKDYEDADLQSTENFNHDHIARLYCSRLYDSRDNLAGAVIALGNGIQVGSVE